MKNFLPVCEMLRHALMHAEWSIEDWLMAHRNCDDEEMLREREFYENLYRQIRQYRHKRFGKTRLEKNTENAESIDVFSAIAQNKVVETFGGKGPRGKVGKSRKTRPERSQGKP